MELVKIIELGRLCLQLGRVNRATFHEDGQRPESDTDHTVMLGVVACAVAQQIAPHLDLGLVAQFALVHDVIEVHAGDTMTLGASEQDLTAKRGREAAAFGLLADQFMGSMPWLITRIIAYESQVTPEARFVKILDKVMPCITHLLNGGATLRGRDLDLRAFHAAQREKLASLNQPEALALLAAVHELLDEATK